MNGGLRPFPRAELAGSAVEVAPRLLGARLVAGVGAERVVLRLVEVEAYAGADDPASHAFRGPTERTAVMFGPAGHAYVYFTYGMHHCLNVTCGSQGRAAAVLLRAGRVEAGLETVRERRPGLPERDLARGPGRLCRALGIDRGCNGTDLSDAWGPLWLAVGEPPARDRIGRGPRVGVSRAVENPWRFWIEGEPAVSAYRQGTRAARRPGVHATDGAPGDGSTGPPRG